MTKEDKPGRLDELDGLRGFLAMWVLISHMFNWCGLNEIRAHPQLESLWWCFLSGSAPVQTFMILSGFAISFLLHSRNESYGEFMKGRFFRIYPVYIACLILGILSSPFAQTIINSAPWHATSYLQNVGGIYTSPATHFYSHVFWHLTLLNGLLPRQLLESSASTLLTPAWSITLEWQYYLVAPLVAIMVRSAKGILALALVALLGLQFGGSWQNTLLAFLPAQLVPFLIGIGSYHLYVWSKSIAAEQRKIFALFVAVTIAGAILTKTGHTVALVMWAVCFGSIFVRGSDVFSRALALVRFILLHPALQSLGKWSYPLYLIHWPMIVILLRLLLYFCPAVSSYEAVLSLLFIGLPLILFLANLLHRYIELPGMALGKRLSRQRTIPQLAGT